MQTLTGSCFCAAGLHSHATHVFEQPAYPEGYPCNVVEELVVDDLLKEQTASNPAVCVCAYMYVAEPRTPQHAAFQHAHVLGLLLTGQVPQSRILPGRASPQHCSFAWACLILLARLAL